MNIKQLAKELGLSTSTVSRALNGYTDVNEETRKRVQEVANLRGYRPNSGARRLVRGSTEAIGLVYSAAVENLGNPQFLDMAGGLAARLRQDEFDLLLAVASDEHETHIYDRLFRGGRVDAVVVPNTRVHDHRLDYLHSKGYPFLAYGRSANCAQYSWFDFDNVLGGHLAVQHLLALGHTRLGYVHAPLELNYAHQRRQGFLAALHAAGLDCPAAYQAGPAIHRQSGIAAAQKLLGLRERPSAIVVDNNMGGAGVIQGLIESGMGLGVDMSVVVHGHIAADTLPLGLQVTTVSQPTAESTGTGMAEMLLQIVHAPTALPLQVLRAPVLIAGATTGRL